MRKQQVVNEISTRTGIPKVDVLVALEQFFKVVAEQVAKGDDVTLRGFGTFNAKLRAAKIGRNIKKKTTVEIPAHYTPVFKPAKEFKQQVIKKLGKNAHKDNHPY